MKRLFSSLLFPMMGILGLVGTMLPLLGLTEAIAGSPFYLTVDRSFPSSEKPEVRLDYTTTQKPLRVRVLRPSSLERFLDGQLQISRSYEPPANELNPGYFFVRGLNKTRSPLKVFRGMLDSEFRTSLHDTVFHEALQETTRGDLASAPEQVILGPPDGFSLVQERFVDLEFGGENVKDLAWWFGDSSWDEYRYKIRKIVLDPLPDGVYLLQAVQGKTEAQCLLQVSSLSVQVKQSSEQLVVRVIDRQLDPVEGAVVSYRDGRGKWQPIKEKTNAFGELSFANPAGILDGRLVVRVETADRRQALVETDFLPTMAKDHSVFIVTDRPVFKPGESFFYKGVVRFYENGQLNLPDLEDPQADISLIRTDGTSTDLKAKVPVTPFGSFSGGFDLDEVQPPGLYRLVAEIGKKPYAGEFRVRDYVKPTFYLELIDRSPIVVPGESFFIKFRAKRYTGGIPQNVKFEVFLYRKKFEIPQFVMEAGAGLSAESDYQGQIRSASSLTEPKRIFSSVEARLAAQGDLYAANSWDSAPFLNDAGEADFMFQIPKMGSEADGEWIYSLMVRAMESTGSQAVVTENIFATLSEAHPAIQFSKPVVQTGDKVQTIVIRTTYPDGKPAPAAGGVIDMSLEQGTGDAKNYLKLPFTTDEKGVCRIPLPELTIKGRLSAVATLETLSGKSMKHPAVSQPAVTIVSGAEGEAVLENRDLELYSSATVLSPGDKASVFAMLPAGWGKGEKGTIWETVAGTRVYETRPCEFQGRSHWFEVEAKPEYGTGFYHTVTVPMGGGKYREQTLGFRIIPQSKRLEIVVRPEREQTDPLKPFRVDFEVRDINGKPAADTELAVTIVDRAVYAVQAEMRPGIFDFFYPLPRLNLATFYSDDLQGYGYADLLKKPNFKLGALKSQSRLTKKAMRDTAGWFPHVVTDAEGRATVIVDMPANVTEWLVTAIATDKTGRVGESRGKFRSVTDVSVDILAPQFLRTGDEADIHVKTLNHTDQPVSIKGDLELTGEATMKGGSRESSYSLEPKEEHLVPVRLEGNGKKGVAELSVTLSSEDNVHLSGAESFEIPLKPDGLSQIVTANYLQNHLSTVFPDAADVRELKIQISSGLLGAALSAAEALVLYPYGCTEQLVHSTIPNLVLLDLVKQAGIDRDRLGPLALPLSRAEKNAEIGIRKITRNQKTDGGFGLWQSDPNSSLAVTLTALSALKFACDLHVEGAQWSYYKGLEWLEMLKSPDLLKEDTLLRGYVLSRISEIVGPQRYKEQIIYVKDVSGQSEASLNDLIYALRIFASNKGKSWSPFNDGVKNLEIEEGLIEKLQNALERIDPNTFEGDSSPLETMGFGFQAPSIISAGMGVLDTLNALPVGLENKLKAVLLSYLRNGFWCSTYDTAQVIFNCKGIFGREATAFAKENAGNLHPIQVRKKDGTRIGTLNYIPSGFIGIFPSPGVPVDLSELTLDGVASNDVVTASFRVDVPYGVLTARSQGMTVERRFHRITGKAAEIFEPSQALHLGDLIVSEVRVKRNPTPGHRMIPSRFLVVEDGIPSLAQGLDEDQRYLSDAGIQSKDDSYWNTIKETQRTPEKIVRIARVMPSGELRMYQVWRVGFIGRATIPPARAFDMYDESIQGNTVASSIWVE